MVSQRAPGFSLIEVLVSLAIIAIMLLGMDALQLSSLHTAQINNSRACAYQQLRNMQVILMRLKRIDSWWDSVWVKENKSLSLDGYVSGSYPTFHIKICGERIACIKSEVIVSLK